MNFPVIKNCAYVLINVPDMMINNGTTQTLERENNPDSEYLKGINRHLRTFDEVVAYAPNQVYVGNITPEELSALKRPWYNQKINNATRFGKFGEIMPQEEFYGMLKISDSFDLVKLSRSFTEIIKDKFEAHSILKGSLSKLGEGEELEIIEKLIASKQAEGLYQYGELIGCVKRAHEFDKNLSAHIIMENLSVKASGALVLMNLLKTSGILPEKIDYIIECSEEAVGDMNQRGGGNIAKSCGEVAGITGATGVDMRGFCAGPSHAIISAAALVKAGVYKNAVVFAGGSTAKLGMNGKDHVKKGMPIIEDYLGGFAVLISEDDGINPVIRTDMVGRHTIGDGASPQAVMEALVLKPLSSKGLRITDVDKYAPEMQTAEITEAAGAGDIPLQNYKMIGALAVKSGQLERKELSNFIIKHGYPGYAPTQGHIPSGVPILGHACKKILQGNMNRCMIIGKGSLFLGRMTNLFDGVSVVIEKNSELKAEEKNLNEAADAQKDCGHGKIKIGITLFDSEHGIDELIKGAETAANKYNDFGIVLIGPKIKSNLEIIEVIDSEDAHKKMLELLNSGEIDGCVTQHFNFPMGVSSIGKISSPYNGKEVLIASTTGSASTKRVEAMVYNAISGISVAKTLGIENPKIGILNIEGGKKVEHILSSLSKNGYKLDFAKSTRMDGGNLLRGNDIINGDADIIICDSLTGNILIKLFSSFSSGGKFETVGGGYGPGVGKSIEKVINIISRASGASVICEALKYCAQCVQNDLVNIAKKEFQTAISHGLENILKQNGVSQNLMESLRIPKRKVVCCQISGIDILELDNACKALLNEGIYSESGMGCTGPVILVSEEDNLPAQTLLERLGYKN